MPFYDFPESPTYEIVGEVLRKTSKGEKVYSMAIGEPSYDTPREISEAAFESMKEGMTHYTSSLGIPEVRAAVVRKVKRKNGIICQEKNTIFISSKLAIYGILVALRDRDGGEVLVPNPGYFYTEPAELAGLDPVPYSLDEDCGLDVDAIASRITPRTKAIIINTPSNPTGRVYSKESLKSLLELCRGKSLKIISDEAYEDLVYQGKHVSMGSLEEKPEHVISLFTLSKSYAMTGWRAGYVVADEHFVKRMGRFMDQTFTCFPPFIQHASAIALDTMDGRVEEFRKDLEKKREFTLRRLGEVEGLHVNKVEGAFYMFPAFDSRKSSYQIATSLLREHNVAVLPGSVFGSQGEGHLRLSYSVSMETISEAMDRMKVFFSKIQ